MSDKAADSLQSQLQAIYEEQFWKPCETKEQLRLWILTYLGIELPDTVVSQYSDSCPMDFVWDVYSAALTGDPKRTSFVVAASRNSMKCLQEGTLVATPSGPVPIEKINIGDTVYDHVGKPIKVIGHWDQGEQPVYALRHGREIIAHATEKHIWSTFDTRKPAVFEDKKTSELREGRHIKRIELNVPFGSRKVPEAYAIGALLGDGCSTEDGVRISSSDNRIPDKVAELLGSPGVTKLNGNHTYIVRSPLGPGKRWECSEFYEKWCRDRKAHEKLASYEEILKWDRRSIVAFIAGLIDTDGSVFVRNGSLYFSLGMQAREVIETFQKLFFALWQRTPKIEEIHVASKKWGAYKNGPLLKAEINHNHFCVRAYRELEEFLVVKKIAPEIIDSLSSNNFNPAGFGVKKEFVGVRRCYDLTVDSPESLYCLHNGAVTHNTLTSAVIEFLMMVHFGRDIVHQAAILDQSLACIGYLDRFLALPMVMKHADSDSKRQKILRNMPLNPYKKIGYAKLQVIVATRKSANAQRASCLIFDELDLIDKDVLSESTFIADPDRTGKPPIFIYLSSRKSAVGPIQEKIEMASDPSSGVRLHRWNIVDFMKPCPPERHQPELPRSDMYIHRETLLLKDKESFDNIPISMKDSYDHVSAYEGCKKCPIFVVCRTESARQTGKSPALRDIPFVATVLRDSADPEKINAQMLNLKPESGGTVFNKFSRHLHKKKLNDAWVFAFNQEYRKDQPLTKKLFIKELRDNGWRVNDGVDFGYVDTAASVLVAYQKSTEKVIVLHVEASPGFSNQDWLVFIKNRVFMEYGFDLLCPDTADKSSPGFASGLGMPCRNTKPSRIETGVSWIRTRLWNASKQEVQFIVLEDDENPASELFMKSLENWQYLKTAMGFDFSQFSDDDWTHTIDALRYAIDPFISNHMSVLSAGQRDNRVDRTVKGVETAEQMQRAIKEHYWNEFGLDLSEQKDDNEITTSGGVTITF